MVLVSNLEKPASSVPVSQHFVPLLLSLSLSLELLDSLDGSNSHNLSLVYLVQLKILTNRTELVTDGFGYGLDKMKTSGFYYGIGFGYMFLFRFYQ